MESKTLTGARMELRSVEVWPILGNGWLKMQVRFNAPAPSGGLEEELREWRLRSFQRASRSFGRLLSAHKLTGALTLATDAVYVSLGEMGVRFDANFAPTEVGATESEVKAAFQLWGLRILKKERRELADFVRLLQHRAANARYRARKKSGN